MSSRTTTRLGRPRPVIDEASVVRSAGGRQIDWANVPIGYKQSDGLKFIPAFTAMGDTLSGGKLRPHVDTTNVAIGVLETDAKEGALHDALSGYGVITRADCHENLMPDATGGPPRALPAGIKSALTDLGFRFPSNYGDAR